MVRDSRPEEAANLAEATCCQAVVSQSRAAVENGRAVQGRSGGRSPRCGLVVARCDAAGPQKLPALVQSLSSPYLGEASSRRQSL